MLRNQGWKVNHKRVERIWRQEGQKVPSKQPKRSRLWLNDGSCVRVRPQYPDHVWSYDFMLEREIFYTVKEARYLIEMWRKEYNQLRPHSSLGYRPPAPSTWITIGEPFERVSLT